MSPKKIGFIIIILILFTLLPSHLQASSKPLTSGDIIINELMWMGSSASTADEWIELKNTTSHSLDLTGFVLSGVSSSGVDLVISSGVIPAGGYFLIANNGKDHIFSGGESVLDIDPDFISSSLSLSNSALQVILKDSFGNVIDIAGDGKVPLAGDNNFKASMERNNWIEDGTKASSWHTATGAINFDLGASERGTPKAENSPPSILDVISIAEARLKPQGEEVLVEGYLTVTSGLLYENVVYLQDDTGGVRVYLESGEFPEGLKLGDKLRVKGKRGSWYGEIEIEVGDPSGIEKLTENNLVNPLTIETGKLNLYEGLLVRISGTVSQTSGDTFYITDGTGEAKVYIRQATQINKPKMSKGDSCVVLGIVSSYNAAFRILPRYQDDIKVTSREDPEITPPLLSIKEARKIKNGEKVRVRGWVTVPPIVLGRQIFYLQDTSAGIQIYSYFSRFPQLSLGDFIEVSGELSESLGERRIKTDSSSDFQILKQGSIPYPLWVKTGNISESTEGLLVKVTGRVVETGGDIFYLDDGSGKVKIYIKETTGIQKPRMFKGDLVTIYGICSQTKTGYRILPRYQGDIFIVAKKKEEKKEINLIPKAEAASPQPFIERKSATQKVNLFKIIGWVIIGLGFIGLLGLKFHDKISAHYKK